MTQENGKTKYYALMEELKCPDFEWKGKGRRKAALRK